MDKVNTDIKPAMQNPIVTDSGRLASFDEWIAHKQRCRKMFEEAQLSWRVSREDYFAQLATVVSINKSMAKSSNKF